MRKRILITGGNGFVGRHVARMLYDDHTVCVVDNLRSGPLRFLPLESGKLQFEAIDIRDMAAVDRCVSAFAPDTIIHLAAIHYIPECETDPKLAVETNINGSINLLLGAPKGCRFVFASSGAVYAPDSKPHVESDAALGPSDVYGYTKLHGENYVNYFASQRGLSAVVVRLFNVVGPGETNPHLLPEIFAQLKAGRKTLRLGNMWPKRDYIHVRDAARGFVTVAVKDEIRNSGPLTVNLGTSQSYSVDEIISLIKQIAPIEFSVEQEQARLRKVDRPHLAADIREIGSRFGWAPQWTLKDALIDLWQRPDLSPRLEARYR